MDGISHLFRISPALSKTVNAGLALTSVFLVRSYKQTTPSLEAAFEVLQGGT